LTLLYAVHMFAKPQMALKTYVQALQKWPVEAGRGKCDSTMGNCRSRSQDPKWNAILHSHISWAKSEDKSCIFPLGISETVPRFLSYRLYIAGEVCTCNLNHRLPPITRVPEPIHRSNVDLNSLLT
jgi:hypothetical protein